MELLGFNFREAEKRLKQRLTLKEQEEREEIRQEKDKEKKIKENIPIIKKELFDVIRAVNVHVFQGSGRIEGWKRFKKRWKTVTPGYIDAGIGYEPEKTEYHMRNSEGLVLSVRGRYSYEFSLIYGSGVDKYSYPKFSDNLMILRGKAFSIYLSEDWEEIVNIAKQDLIDDIKKTTEE